MITSDSELSSLITLNRIFGSRPEMGSRLISEIGSASGVFRLGKEELDTIFGPYSKYRELITHEEQDRGFRELEWLRARGYSFLGVTDPDYPETLKECCDHPIGMYLRSGDSPEGIFGQRPAVSIIGTRDLSPYGREWCRKIVMALSECESKPLIVSGLALGADICAHTAALEFGLPTLAVMATGIERIYPGRHHQWAGRISGTPGSGLVTDFPPGTFPMAYNFLRRNRIIAGLGLATILIESKAKGGGMMTAGLAFGYGRNVFALPGRIDDTRSAGCNELISKNIAAPITSMGSLLQAIGLTGGELVRRKPLSERMAEMYGGRMTGEEMASMLTLLQAIRDSRGITPDELCSTTGLPFRTVRSLISILESDGIIDVDVLERCCIDAKFA